MTTNPITRIHARKRNRLKGYDYSEEGFYFVTICVKNRIACFGKIENGEMVLNKYGEIVQQQWLWLENQYKYVYLDQYVVMPNHIQGIIAINSSINVGTGRDRNNVGTGRDLSLQIKIKTLSELMGAFKTTSSKLIHDIGFSNFRWQRSFYDHIIRNAKSLQKIRKYIMDNPLKWQLDRNNPANLYM